MKICKVPNCGKECFKNSGLCSMHRTRMTRYKSLFLPSEGKTQEESDAIHAYIPQEERHKNAKGKICCISGCDTQLYAHGTICSKHRWRFKNFGSYDMPGHIGMPSEPIRDFLPDGYVHRCRKKHGLLTIEQVYIRTHRKQKTESYWCKLCARDSNIKKNYEGMESMECYNKMLESQNGLCKICNQPSKQKSNNGKSIKSLAVDHCHITGKVRGLLCGDCNSMLGYAKDSINILKSAIEYLKLNA